MNEQQMTNEPPSGHPTESGRQALRAGLSLLVISFLTLYFELLIVRWLPTEIRVLAYFSNVTLISAVLGLGVGTLVPRQRQFKPALFPACLLLLVLLALVYGGFNVRLPLAERGNFVWNGWSLTARGTTTQYVALIGFLAVNTITFVPLGQALAVRFDRLKALTAYSVNVTGALLGIGAFALFSYLQLAPWLWFAFGSLLVLPFMPRRRSAPVLLGLAILAVFIVSSPEGTLWSPYYKIVVRPIHSGTDSVGFNVYVNADSHQQALDLSGQHQNPDLEARARVYDLPYQFGHNDDVLVVGAGTGNDVAAALRAGARRVEAVDIDPVILELGNEHPERPFADPRVTIINTDARGHVRRSKQLYDKIVLGYLDSHALFSAMSSGVRLDNFVYTKEFFRELAGHLKPDGIISVTFTIHEEWIADRLFRLFTETFGHAPLAYQGTAAANGTVFLGSVDPLPTTAGSTSVDPRNSTGSGYSWTYGSAEGFVPATVFRTDVAVPSDDWPFLYLREPSIPANYLICLLILGFAAIVFVGRQLPAGEGVDLHFFFLGAAFLLVETKALTELAIFMGSTWLVNAFVISGILVVILLANLTVARVKRISVEWVYGALGAVIIATYLVGLDGLLDWESPLRNWTAAGILCIPLFFAGLVFATHILAERRPSRALGSNMLGAALGGLAEYTSMALGLSALYLLAFAFYALSYVVYRWPALRTFRVPSLGRLRGRTVPLVSPNP